MISSDSGLLTELVDRAVLVSPGPFGGRKDKELKRLCEELACDEFAAITVGDRLAYARYLIEVAGSNCKTSTRQPGIAMARSSEIKKRVQALLDPSQPLSAQISWRTMGTMLLIGTPLIVLLAALHPTFAHLDGAEKSDSTKEPQNAIPAADQQLEPATVEGPMMTLRGTVVMPDGSVAKDAVLEREPSSGSTDVLSATLADGRFEIQTRGNRVNPSGFLIRTPDWSLQAPLHCRERTLRIDCASSMKLTLAPTKTVHVKVVTREQQPVADSRVQVVAGSYSYQGKTRADGVAKFQIPRDGIVFMISAWTDDHKTGGLNLGRIIRHGEFRCA